MKRLAILGSTGSIGTSTLDVVARFPDRFEVVALAAGHNLELAAAQAKRYRPRLLATADEEDARWLRDELPGIEVLAGEAGRVAVATHPDASTVVGALVGALGLVPTWRALELGKDVLLANKETLVVAGALVMDLARRTGARLLPIDSEHSALHQALRSGAPEAVRRLILTASGGPFRTFPAAELEHVTVEQALAHPTWRMGAKITVDSATMMNKGLEIIEAYWLFGVDLSRIQVVVHPQSIVHSMVEFRDMSIKAQLGVPDMRSAIAYALSWPSRMELDLKPLDPAAMKKLEFFPPDEDKFPALELARASMEQPRTLPCVMNAADETAVDGFLKRRIRFDGIIDIVRKTMDKLAGSRVSSPEDLIELDRESRKIAGNMIP